MRDAEDKEMHVPEHFSKVRLMPNQSSINQSITQIASQDQVPARYAQA